MITSNTTRAGHASNASRVLVQIAGGSGRQSGLLMDSVIMMDNLTTVHDNEIDRVLGTLPDPGEVNTALRVTLAL